MVTTVLSVEIQLLLDFATLDPVESSKYFSEIKRELEQVFQDCDLSCKEEFDVAMMFGVGIFKIGPFKFDRIVAVDQHVDQRDQARLLESGIKGRKRKRQDEVPSHDWPSNGVDEQSKKRVKQDATGQWETQENKRFSTDCSVNKNEFVRDWLQCQSNISYEIEAPYFLPVFQKLETISYLPEISQNDNETETEMKLNTPNAPSQESNLRKHPQKMTPKILKGIFSNRTGHTPKQIFQEAKVNKRLVESEFSQASSSNQSCENNLATVSRSESLKVIFFKTDCGNWAIKNTAFECQAIDCKKTEVSSLIFDEISKEIKAENEARKRVEVLQRVKRALARDRSNQKEKKGSLRKKTRLTRIRKQVSNLFEMKARLRSRNFRTSG